MTKHVAVHTPLCLERQAALKTYEQQYPNYCRYCHGCGVINNPGSREEQPSSEPCGNCVEHGRCPRCIEETETAEHESCDYVMCKSCGFNEWAVIRDGTYYGAPEVECVCVQPTKFDVFWQWGPLSGERGRHIDIDFKLPFGRRGYLHIRYGKE